MKIIPKKINGMPGWFFQYGVWDLRVDCPICNQWEAFYLNGHSSVNEEGIVSHPGKCRACGWSEPFKLEGCTPEIRNMVDAYAKT